MSFGFSTPIGASRIERSLLLAGASGAAACLAAVAVSLAWVAVLAACLAPAVLLLAGRFLRRSAAMRAVTGTVAGMTLEAADGTCLALEPVDVFLSPLLIAFRARPLEGSTKQLVTVSLWRDAVCADAFRRAAVYGRWLAAGSAVAGQVAA
jgi:hypothetical protein